MTIKQMRSILLKISSVILLSTFGFAESPLIGVNNGAFFNVPVTLKLSDQYTSDIQMKLNGEFWADGNTIQYDGSYTVEFTSPKELQPISFTIDRTPPKITFEQPPKGVVPLVRVADENVDPTGLQLLMDGLPYDRSMILKPGKHVLQASTADLAGNTAMDSTDVTIPLSCTPETYVDYVSPTTTYSAVHYYPWFKGNGSHTCPNSSWCYCIFGPKGIEPYLGFYASSTATIVDAHLTEMKNNGVDVVSVEWTGDSYTTNNYLNLILPKAAAKGLKVVLLYDTAIRLGPTINMDNSVTRSQIIADFATFSSSTNYFKNASYLKFKNKPVVYLYVSRAIGGSSTNLQSVFDTIRQNAGANGFGGIYFIADHLFWNQSGNGSLNRIALMGAFATSSFAPVSPTEGVPEIDSQRPVKTWADKLASLYSSRIISLLSDTRGVDITPGIFTQYDDRGFDDTRCTSDLRTVHNWHLLDGTDWTYMINKGLNSRYIAEVHTVQPNCNELVMTNSDYQSIVWSYSYNEWGEGSGVERLVTRTPRFPYAFGTDLLNLLKAKLP